MRRAIILMLDSFGIGASADANKFDRDANTLGNIVKACASAELGRGPLQLANLSKYGLQLAAEASAGKLSHPLAEPTEIHAAYGYAVEQSLGKDTPSGHWEMAGVPVMFDWGYFPQQANCFPSQLIQDFIAKANLPGVLGCEHASGTEIIKRLGLEHIKTGKPIVYTSADSVFQIAAHEDYFGLERLYEVCQIARKLVDKYKIGRVIARPFVGENGEFQRTYNRKDLATPPPAPTLLDKLVAAGGKVISVGKISDIYAGSGISKAVKATNNMSLFDATLKELTIAGDKTLIFTNFVDFDSKYGHRRDALGYANALEAFDARLPELEKLLQPGDLVVMTADHGCDPTWPGTDHTREHVPVLFFGSEVKPCDLGRRESFADIGQTLAAYLGVEALEHGVACF